MTHPPRTDRSSDGREDEAASLRRREEAVVRAFEGLKDRMDTYRYLAQLAHALPPFPDSEKSEETFVPGCTAELWLKASLDQGRVRFAVDSPALVVKGLAAILIEVLSDSTPEAIAGADLGFIKTIGLEHHLSASRSNGLATMVQRMRAFAEAHLEDAE